MLTIERGTIKSDSGKIFRKRGGDDCWSERTLLPSESLEDFEELDEAPRYTREQYEELVERLIARRYTLGQEIAIERQRESKPEGWAEHNEYCEQCKREARELLEKGGGEEL